MKRFFALLLVLIFCFTGCTVDSKGTSEIAATVQETISATTSEKDSETKDSKTGEISLSDGTTATEAQNLNFTALNDPDLLQYVKEKVYTDVVKGLDSENYFVENVDTVYISKEYLDELSYNSQENVYFGYKLSDVVSQWGDEKYVFTVDENGQMIVQAFEAYDDTYDKALRNVAIGTGVILVCVTVSVVTGGVGAASAVSAIFAASAKTGAEMALSSGVIGGAATAIVCGIEGKSVDDTLKATTLAASEEFMWGAIGGAVAGGASKAIALKGATLKGLTMNEAAQIQKDSGYPLDVIKNFKTMEQYNICKEAGLVPYNINGKTALIRKIDLEITDELGRTNLQRMKLGYAALDKDGQAYELHHIGQQADSTLAILTESEHRRNGNNKIWHEFGKSTEVHGSGNNWDKQRKEFWEDLAKQIEDGVLSYGH